MSAHDTASLTEAIDRFSARALELAQKGIALAHPNPVVGALVVNDGRIVGEGFHEYDKLDHAEVIALRQAGGRARAATLYVSLEPCCTTSRTGPCTQAIIESGIRRVVASMPDPNPSVSGKGFAQLRSAGIQVDVGLHEIDARRLNEDFARWIRTGLPLVVLKTALTLDGQIALRKGSTTWITSEQSREQVQKLRHEADALLTGIGTVLADDPRMSDRTGLPRRRRLLRAVVDSRLRMPLKSNLVKSAEGDLIIFTSQPLDSPRAKALMRAGVEVFHTRPRNRAGHVCLDTVVHELGRREILNVILEGGSALNGASLQTGIVDKMILFYAPRIMGTGGVPVVGLPAASWFKKSHALSNLRVSQVGPDFCVEGYFHDVYWDHRSRRKD
ncbi:MAG TPA: bifunctional diaminohydroxyphosphoribosylaminopyrimidine deaminase/5-amino-6-(5-phosphoribosylamino)uracil reductase RibD [Candidatus Acidoferrales bacterium]|nr:bifunctional diaminohydroxyphosphoribosylaminopyrimidine deaminase/5-amino-6-(5-phosphoribosylamino)uracil reductase RibD [Candidatus Acidoferrales bacterium]